MSIRVVTPALSIVSLIEAKHHLRVDQDLDDDDTYIESLIAAAQGWIDGPAGWLGRSIGPQLLDYRPDRPCSSVIELPYGPVLAIDAAWIGGTSVPVDGWTLGDRDFAFDGAVGAGDYRVRYWAGYGKPIDQPGEDGVKWTPDAPEPIKQAVLLLVGQWWMVREAVNVGNIVNQMPFAVEALLQPYRVWR